MEANITFFPKYKSCSYCKALIYRMTYISNQPYFFCFRCGSKTLWSHNTLLEKSKLPMTTIEKLITLFLDSHTVSEAHSILNYSFVSEKMNINTVRHYFGIFSTIVYDTIYDCMNTTLLDGEVEIDETCLVKDKKSSAPHRRPKNSFQWLFGLKKRGSTEFVVYPVMKRDSANIIPLILKHVDIKAIIYSDCYSVYVNNNTTPKSSNLIQYGYGHLYVNHKKEFVSALLNTVHTNTVERLWGEIKGYLKKMRSTKRFMFYIYRYYFAKNLTKENQFVILIKILYTEKYLLN